MDGLPLRGRCAQWVGSIAFTGITICLPAGAVAAEKAAAPKEVTFCEHIAPILFENCATCHRPGEIAPFSLLSYESARKRADFLAEITADRRMPPWKPDTSVGRYRNERHLTGEQIELIAKWAAAGAPQGDPQALPEPPKFVDGWQLGEPDLIVQMSEPFAVPAGGRDVYRCFSIPIPVEEDRMVSAVEFRPGNSRVVHHAIMFLDADHAARELCGKDGQAGYESFGGPTIVPTGGLGAWVPGTMPQPLPDGIVQYMRAGSDLVLHMHYHPTGKPEIDQSTVGIHFSKKPAERIVTGIAIVQTDLHIPAGRRHFHVRAESEPLPVDVYVLGVTPHMHNLGRQIKVTAVDPSGKRTAPLIWIKDWDFNWQGAYQFVRPLRLPKGSTIQVQAYYDNSKHNPKNPNSPPREVSWGEQTNDEMCLVSVQVFTDTMDDLREIARMPAHELAAGMEGGVPRALAEPRAVTEDSTEKQPTNVAANQPTGKKANVKGSGSGSLKIPADGLSIPEQVRPLFRRMDADGNGLLTQQELDALPEAARERIVKNLLAAQPKGGN